MQRGGKGCDVGGVASTVHCGVNPKGCVKRGGTGSLPQAVGQYVRGCEGACTVHAMRARCDACPKDMACISLPSHMADRVGSLFKRPLQTLRKHCALLPPHKCLRDGHSILLPCPNVPEMQCIVFVVLRRRSSKIARKQFSSFVGGCIVAQEAD